MKRLIQLSVFLSFFVEALLYTLSVSGNDTFSENNESSYTITVNGESVAVNRYKDISYAQFIFFCTAEIKIKVQGDIEDYKISPASYHIESVHGEREISFRLDEPRKLVLDIKGFEKLFIFAEPQGQDRVLKQVEGEVVNIMDFGVDNSGTRAVTGEINRVIEKTSAAGGGVVYFPAGVYLTGNIFLKNNVTLYMEQGARIQGSRNPADYEVLTREQGDRYGSIAGLITIRDVHHAGIAGYGVIDADGMYLRTGSGLNGITQTIAVSNSSNIEIRDVILRDSRAWTVHIIYSDSVRINNIKIINDLANLNTDGINPDASTNVIIENMFAYCSDDNIAIKSTGRFDMIRDVRNIVVRNSVFYTIKSSLKLGTESRNNLFSDILFENIDIISADRAFTFYLRDGADYENVTFRDIRVEHISEIQRPGYKARLIDMIISERGVLGTIEHVLF